MRSAIDEQNISRNCLPGKWEKETEDSLQVDLKNEDVPVPSQDQIEAVRNNQAR